MHNGDSGSDERERSASISPAAVLEALTRNPSTCGLSHVSARNATSNTGRLLGIPPRECSIKSGDCAHVGETCCDVAGADDPAPTVIQLCATTSKLRSKARTVQTLLTELERAEAETGRKPRRSVTLPCPRCESQGVSEPNQICVGVPCRREQNVATFFARVGPEGLGSPGFELDAPSPTLHSHIVTVFGDEYCLCGVIYALRSGAGSRFVSQVYLEGGWWTYADVRGGGRLQRTLTGSFDDDFEAGKEDLLMYVRLNVVENRYGAQVIPRGPKQRAVRVLAPRPRKVGVNAGKQRRDSQPTLYPPSVGVEARESRSDSVSDHGRRQYPESR